jgi:hypothetical protein
MRHSRIRIGSRCNDCGETAVGDRASAIAESGANLSAMKVWNQFGGWLGGLGLGVLLSLALTLSGPCAAAARQRSKDRPPAPAERKAERENRRNDRPPNVEPGNGARFNGGVNPNRPPGAGTRNRVNPQERLRNMTPQERQRLSQNEERLQRLPPAQRQVLRDRAQVWQRMTPEQRQHIQNDVLPRWRQMTPDRRQAVQQRLRLLQNMPEGARNQRLNDPNFTRGMSEEDRSTLRDLSHLHVGGAPE